MTLALGRREGGVMVARHLCLIILSLPWTPLLQTASAQEICGNHMDDDEDGDSDCYDADCAQEPACAPVDEICNNRLDDDFDRFTDCEDSDCHESEFCDPRPEICGNRWDDDFDGKFDCGDEACSDDEACKAAPDEICTNARDDDLDLLIDCADPDCQPGPVCDGPHEICDNDRDDDADTKVDCNDSDCTRDARCAPLFIRGDVDDDSRITITDVILSMPVGAFPRRRDCVDAQDANDDGTLSILDAITIIRYLFQQGPALPLPFRDCGVDPTPDSLKCEEVPCPFP